VASAPPSRCSCAAVPYFHIVSLAFGLYFWPCIDSQTWPGAFATNLPGMGSLLCVIAAGVLQGKQERKLIDAQPERFPPPPTKFIKEGD